MMKNRIAIWFVAVSFLTSFARAQELEIEEVEQLGDQEVPSLTEEPPPLLASQKPVFLQYYGIFFGPALKSPSSLIPTPDGELSPDLPLHIKNFLAVGYNINEQIAVSGTAFWIWKPVQGHTLTLRDPFLRVSHSGLFNTEHFNLYSDFRVHLGLSDMAKFQDFLTGFQLFHAVSYVPDNEGRWVLSLFGSARYNVFGKHGRGNDLELYLAPHLSYRFMPTLAFTLLYEMQAVHPFGARAGTLENDGTDLEPGLEWNVTPSLTLNPYVNLYPGNQMTLKTSTFGMTMSWNIL